MPLISFVPKEQIEKQHELLVALDEKLTTCDLLKDKIIDGEFIYTMYSNENTNSKPQFSMFAVAYYDNFKRYALLTPNYLCMKPSHGNEVLYEFDPTIFKSFLLDISDNKDIEVIVFSEKTYNQITKYNCNKQINITLYV